MNCKVLEGVADAVRTSYGAAKLPSKRSEAECADKAIRRCAGRAGSRAFRLAVKLRALCMAIAILSPGCRRTLHPRALIPNLLPDLAAFIPERRAKVYYKSKRVTIVGIPD